MSVYRRNFLSVQSIILETLQQPYTVDSGVSASVDNERARLIRNGLAIMIFSSLEEFVRRRTLETLRNIDSSKVIFSDLPEKLCYMLAYGAINGIYQQTNRA